MKEYIIGYILRGCPYSMMADEILRKNPNNGGFKGGGRPPGGQSPGAAW
jgi:hypothetical protein